VKEIETISEITIERGETGNAGPNLTKEVVTKGRSNEQHVAPDQPNNGLGITVVLLLPNSGAA